ncbi:ABC transporter substrate-binding protein [Alteromonas sp. ASW11-36]|uniref:ABC transporter substrate-binding protein n=1 Tax=Alteromonas arenosi TaxID=3055817 RepID=A0ABT7SY77_9ALTE|nr:ABC transporter substrate-binding protein [Alteromonas sp. ASW11-36]MDM7861136.1 ABC transporter substrate-binding protein [Alteromonas sp. ASW11-36]
MRCLLILVALNLSVFANAERLVSAGGSLTEIVFALGAGNQLVGVDSSSHYPVQARALPDIGYYRALNVEGILSVQPQQLLVLNGTGPQAVLNQLDSLGLKTTVINNPKSLTGLYTTIQQVAEVTDKQAQGEQLITQIQAELAALQQLTSVAGKSVVFLLSAGERGLVAAGSDTMPQLIFEQLDLRNPFVSLSGFKTVSAEILAAENPDIILLASHTSTDTSVELLCQEPQLALWADSRGCQLHKVDSLLFMGLTPRVPQAIAHTHELLVQYAD